MSGRDERKTDRQNADSVEARAAQGLDGARRLQLASGTLHRRLLPLRLLRGLASFRLTRLFNKPLKN